MIFSYLLYLLICRSKQIHIKYLWILNILREGVDSLSQVNVVAALVRSKAIFALSPPNLPETPLMMSMGVIFAMIVVFLGLVNCSKMGSVFLRNDIGIPSESFFAKMERFFIKLASAKLQHEKADSKFFANLWRFVMLKSAHFPSVYGEKFIFLCRRSVQI